MLVTMIIITSVILLITIVVTVLFFKRWIGFCRVALRDVAEVLGAEPILDLWNVSTSVHGRIHNRPFTVKFTNQTRSSPPTVTVTIPMAHWVAFTARKPNFLDRWCAALGLASPILTGDPWFDGRIYVDTGDPESVRIWLSDARFREGLLALFDADVMRVACERNGLSLVRKLPPRETVAPSLVFDALPGLWDLTEYMTQTADSTTLAHIGRNQAMMRWGLAPGLLFMAGIVLIIVGMSLYEPLYPVFLPVLFWALPWGLCTSSAYVLFVWLFVRSRTDRHILILVILAFALPGCCFATVGWRYFGNGWLDNGAPTQYAATVWETLNKGRGGRKIVFMVDGKLSAEFSRPGGTYPRGLPVELTVRPGHYGIPWVDGWHVTRK